MTLVQVLANESSVHMSCDFRLTDPYTKQVIQNDAHKLVQVRPDFRASTPEMTAFGLLVMR